jgi:hypothetical protein
MVIEIIESPTFELNNVRIVSLKNENTIPVIVNNRNLQGDIIRKESDVNTNDKIIKKVHNKSPIKIRRSNVKPTLSIIQQNHKLISHDSTTAESRVYKRLHDLREINKRFLKKHKTEPAATFNSAMNSNLSHEVLRDIEILIDPKNYKR